MRNNCLILFILIVLCSFIHAQGADYYHPETPSDGKPILREIYAVAGNILALRIDAQDGQSKGITGYQKQAGDEIKLGGYDVENRLVDISGIKDYYDGGTPRLFRNIFRDGKLIGYLAGPNKDSISWVEKKVGEKLDLDWAKNTNSFTLQSQSDGNFATGKKPQNIYRKSRPRKPVNNSESGNFKTDYAQVHEIYLKFNHPLQKDASYELVLNNSPLSVSAISFQFNPLDIRSEAIQVNQNGYLPNGAKIAYLSTWMGNGGGLNYDNIEEFHVYKNNQKVFTGPVEKRNNTLHDDNLTNANVYAMDFSSLNTVGMYKVVIPSIGCSYEFPIQNDIWINAFRTGMRGVLDHRAGIDLNDYLENFHPRDLHPDDGYRLRLAETQTYFSASGTIFDRMQKALVLDSEVKNHWGGWRDAEDFDRQADHMEGVGLLVSLWESNRSYFENLDLNIPESGNAIPDILDEAIWCADVFHRTQREDGAVPGYIESIEHPRAGETPWLESLPLVWVPPRLRDAMIYAGTAGYLSMALAEYDQQLSNKFKTSAIKAYEWAENNPDTPEDKGHEYEAFGRALLGISMYRLSGEQKWLNLFNENVNNNRPYTEELAFIHADNVEEDSKNTYKNRILGDAQGTLNNSTKTIYETARSGWPPNKTWNLVWSDEMGILVAAHRVSQNDQWIQALEKAYLFALGANPKNLVYMTGLGHHPIYPRHKAFRIANQPMPPGLISPGPEDHYQKGDVRKTNDYMDPIIFPEPNQWPDAEYFFPEVDHNEHTIQGMIKGIYGWGYLSQHVREFGEAPVKVYPKENRISDVTKFSARINHDILYLNMDKPALVSLYLRDANGKVMYAQKIRLKKGNHTINLRKTGSYSIGKYFLTIKTPDLQMIRPLFIQ